MRFLVANVTPFDEAGNLALDRLTEHIGWMADAGVHGFVPTGSNGELLYLSRGERRAVHRAVIRAVPELSVYPCTWDPSPAAVEWLIGKAAEDGATGVLVPPPLYYRVEDEVLIDWFRWVASVSIVPVLAYHNPTYFPTDIGEEVYLRLRDEGVLAGMKDSSRDLDRLRRLAEADPFTVYAGGAPVLPEVHAIEGLAGFISALGNAWPRMCLRSFGGEEDARDRVLARAAAVSAAGGFRAMKARLGLGCRPPFPRPSDERLTSVPAAEPWEQSDDR